MIKHVYTYMNHFYKCSKSTWYRACHALKLGSHAIYFYMLIAAGLSGLSHRSLAQDLLDKKISIAQPDITRAKALKIIGQLAECNFAYADEVVQSDKNISLNYKQTALHLILRKAFGIHKDQLRVYGNTIHIGQRDIRKSVVRQSIDTVYQQPKNFSIDPVVITGQYRPQSVNKSIYRVEVIDKRQIENMAVSNVGELLKQQLNIEIENQAGTGRAKIRVLGLNSQYAKILLDNIPIAGDENMGSDVDLSTISMDDVERVEIVKGAMGVEYGANSIAGVINIITKKRANHKVDLGIDLQEETVGSEYNLYLDKRAKGRHIQKINGSVNLSDNLTMGGSFSRDQFNGLWGDYKGAGIYLDEIGPISYPQDRGYDWSPKTSYNGNAYLSYQIKRMSVFYKFNLFQSDVTHYNPNIYPFELKDEGILINASINNDYHNTRYNHHLNLRGDFWKDAHYTLDASLQKNALEHRRQGINLFDNSVIDPANGLPNSNRLQASDWQKLYQSSGFYSKGSVIKPLIKQKIDFNLGYELDNTTGNQGYTQWFNDVSLSSPIQQTLFTGAAYSSFEWQVNSWIMVRPGFRANFSNRLKMRSNESLTTRLRLNQKNDLRIIFGTSTRFPNYQELFSWFVDAVHDYRGNPDLKPEYGKTAELAWTYKTELDNNVHLETNLSSMYQYIRDRIISVTYRVPGESQMTGRNTFDNENKYSGLLNQVNANLVSERFHFSVAASLVGYRGSDNASAGEYNEFLTNFQANGQATYLLPAGFRFALFYRYTGRQPLYVFLPTGIGSDLQPTGYYKVLAKTEDYHSMDVNVAKSLLDRRLDLRIGVRNLFKVTDINYTLINPPAHIVDLDYGQLRLNYGRMLFAKLSYRIFQ